MTADALSAILRRFIIYLEVLPYNLRLFAHTALFFLATINIALTIYNHIDDDNFNYLKWGRVYILKIGFILWAINKYEWFLAGVKDFFFYAVNKAIRINYTTNDYIMDPSKLYSQGQDVAEYVWDNFVSAWPQDWGYWGFYWLILGGFLILTIQIIICWIEYYFLTGFSFIFLPFGALDMGLEYYKNVFKTIIGSTIKLAVMQFWILISSVILKDLFKVIHEKSFGKEKLLILLGTLYVLVAVMQILPSLTSGLLTGSPTVNASSAMAAAMSAAAGATIGVGAKVYHTAKGTYEAGKGAYKGAKSGAAMGDRVGGATGALLSGGNPLAWGAGKIAGGVIGGTLGAIGGGTYAGAKYGFTKQGAEKEDKKDSSEKKTSKTEETNTESSTVPGTTSTNTDTGKNNNSSSSTSSENNNTTVAPVSTDTSTGTINNGSNAIDTATNSTATNNNSTNSPAVDISTGNSTNVNTTNSSSTQGNKIETSNNYSSSTSSENTSTTNSSNVINNNTTTDESIGRSERVKNSLPDWAKEDY